METTLCSVNSCSERQTVKRLKSSLTLNFGEEHGGKKLKSDQFDGLPLLSTPDVGLLKLASPELDRLVIQQFKQQQQQQQQKQNKTVAGVSSTGLATPVQNLLTKPGTVTDEQEAYARGFVEALLELHSRKTTESTNVTVSSSSSSSSFPSSSTLSADDTSSRAFDATWRSRAVRRQPDQFLPMSGDLVGDDVTSVSTSRYVSQLSDLVPTRHQFDTVAAISGSGHVTEVVDTPPISPINMADQERIKLERKRARNRVAATRCRNRKLERIEQLQSQADQLKATNARLTGEVSRLRENVFHLRQDVLRHAGCPVVPPVHPGFYNVGRQDSALV